MLENNFKNYKTCVRCDTGLNKFPFSFNLNCNSKFFSAFDGVKNENVWFL